jgi:hypothetical protein
LSRKFCPLSFTSRRRSADGEKSIPKRVPATGVVKIARADEAGQRSPIDAHQRVARRETDDRHRSSQRLGLLRAESGVSTARRLPPGDPLWLPWLPSMNASVRSTLPRS